MRNFEYLQPKTIEEASIMLAKQGSTGLPYAGGTDALGLMKDNIISPEKVVNLKHLPGMTTKKYTPGEGLRLGALVTVAEVAADQTIENVYPVLSEAANEVASPQLRNVGTVGGNICQRPRCWYFRSDEFHCLRKGGDMCYAFEGQNKYHCIVGGGPCYIVHPSDLAVALLTLNANVTIFDGNKSRAVPISEFFVLPEKDYTVENILKPGEIVTEITIPDLPKGTKSGYIKMKERDVWDFAIVSVGAVVPPPGVKSTEQLLGEKRIAFGGIAPIPWFAQDLNKQLNQTSLTADAIEKLTAASLSNASPLSKNRYKVPLARNLTRQLLNRLVV